ncbi:MAG: NERD domain-containing protein [Deltaproteobacteria bacterium]|nr:NERD domain-containing protein [Deltaproteobacteria bacterium]
MTDVMPRPNGLYPRELPRSTESRAERSLHDALKRDLPEGWVAWHSLRIRGEGREGEGDFVFAVPGKGILVLEVKSGLVQQRDGRWYQGGRALKDAPREQAHRFRHKLRERLERALGGRGPYIEIGTCFPETAFRDEPTADDVRGALLGKQDMPRVGAALSALAARSFRGAEVPSAEVPWVEVLHELWGETWTPRLALGARAALSLDELVRLEDEQLELVDGLEANPRLHVSGGPGTGKTLLARERFTRWRRTGLNPVYLCSTSALAAGLRREGLASVHTVKEYAAALLDAANLDLQDGASPAEWTPEHWELASLRAAHEALPTLGRSHDAVVVDEGQDFTANDWRLVEALAGRGHLWIFSDEGQSFWSDRGVPSHLAQPSYRLRKAYRCPTALAEFAARYRLDAPREAASPIEGLREAAALVALPDDAPLEVGVAAVLSSLLELGAAPSDIAVLTLAGQTRTALGVAEVVGEQRVVRADHPEREAHVVADTFLRFKGLERPYVLVVELEHGERRYDVRMHVALSRALVQAFVVAHASVVARDPRLAVLAAP